MPSGPYERSLSPFMEENAQVIAADVRRRAARCCSESPRRRSRPTRHLGVRAVAHHDQERRWATSFQETTRVFTEGPISGKVEPPSPRLRRPSHLRVLKENRERNGAGGEVPPSWSELGGVQGAPPFKNDGPADPGRYGLRVLPERADPGGRPAVPQLRCGEGGSRRRRRLRRSGRWSTSSSLRRRSRGTRSSNCRLAIADCRSTVVD